ncbi:YjbH domain-containing protein [Vibrio sp. SCSIO 43140]|uniref:YjbH domain-containing protein n=1 Tax=Vibrio sp. SCSIO 43140 TaxID=2819100 RepID=UPI002074D797|nr:YjbH domain-containing protein [Vibrio sp. SCSIO 43140]USD60292.1 YjbH domain-containing protein [Vibrio sp. SCSIO 43140]
MNNTMTPSLIAAAVTLALTATAKADAFKPATLTPSQSDFGGVGLMQMPTGRMAAEGEFSFNGDWNEHYHKYNISLQVMPWLETTIRYTLVQDLLYSNDPSFSGDTKYTDKGIDLKFRLLKEGDYLPETSIGLRDFGGTGLFDGEFIAATKRFGNLDFTLGMGWGYLGTRDNIVNPFCKISDGYCTRPSDLKGSGGMVDYERWFKGPAALFGGIEYQTPWQPLRFKLEYDSNDYSQDFPVVRAGVDMTPSTPWNVGALYQLGNWGDIRASYQRGNAVALGVTLRTNFNDAKSYWLDEPKPELRPTETSDNIAAVDWDKIAGELSKNAGYDDVAIKRSGSSVTIIGKQTKYRDRAEARERAARVLASELPPEISSYKIIETNLNQPQTETQIDVEAFKQIAIEQPIDREVTDAMVETELASDSNGSTEYDGFNRFDYSFRPTLAQSIGSAENFYLYEIGIDGSAEMWTTKNLNLSGTVHLNLLDNYDKFNYIVPPDGTNVPRVRTLFRAYVSDNTLWVKNLQATYFQEFGNGFYGQVYGGYLETMFAGAGGELLYRPLNKNWAIGADVNIVSQRDPRSPFGVFDEEDQSIPEFGRPFKVVTKGTTGFLTGYYMPQWSFIDNTLLKVGVGKFLAGDLGTRIDFSKQFKSGVIAGAYASFTDLSSEEFGEGSFTKGFYVSIPFDIMTVKPSANRASFNWQPITRDGGQMLGRKYELFSVTDARSPWLQRPSSN